MEKGLWRFDQFSQVTKLQSFESGLSDAIPTNVQIFHPWFSLYIFVNFMKKEHFL